MSDKLRELIAKIVRENPNLKKQELYDILISELIRKGRTDEVNKIPALVDKMCFK